MEKKYYVWDKIQRKKMSPLFDSAAQAESFAEDLLAAGGNYDLMIRVQWTRERFGIMEVRTRFFNPSKDR